jgi:AraC-like DNA-binding protein
LSTYISNTISEFYPFENYTKAINEVFKIAHDTAKVDFLENYFILKLVDFKHAFLQQAIKMIENDDAPKISIASLAKTFTISRTTLHKQFLLHIGTSPSQFIKIHRFRNAIKMFTKQATKEQLIDIVYLADYFDQSHMAKDFKSLTGYSPKIFFSKLSQIENNQINWIFS